MNSNVLEVEGLRVSYALKSKGLWGKPKMLHAVNGVDFDIPKGEVLGVVGESGCGKSSLAKAIMGLAPVSSGSIRLLQKDLVRMNKAELREYRQHFQMVFQDPEASLNPRMTIGQLIAEPLKIFFPDWDQQRRQKEVARLMREVGLNPNQISRFPHEFSGGQKQRIGIARALSISPTLLVCDEAVSALDVSIQAQILKLLQQLRESKGLTFLFISHDLAVIRYIASQVMVMYLGRVMEWGPVEEVVNRPRHPYTKALQAAVPRYDRGHKAQALEGEIPSPLNPPPGCPFSGRCPLAEQRCHREAPQLRRIANGHSVACHLVD